jgi:hypothetical protein
MGAILYSFVMLRDKFSFFTTGESLWQRVDPMPGPRVEEISVNFWVIKTIELKKEKLSTF